MAKFLADECFSGPLFRALVAAGFDAVRSIDFSPAASDLDVLATAFRENRVLLTEDTDFGELTVRLQLPTHGVVRIALQALDRNARAERLIASLEMLGDRVVGALSTIEPTRVRVRTIVSG